MTYDEAAEKYCAIRDSLDALERSHKVAKAELSKKLALLESWFTAKAQEDGLTKLNTIAGTAYWSTHFSATVGSAAEFIDYCKQHQAWDLMETRASKTAVKSFIEGHGAPPPGVNCSSISVFNFRKAQPKE